MKHLYVISGAMGVGKTAVCQQLKPLLAPCAFLDGDWCWDMEPFTVNKENRTMVMGHIQYLLRGFLQNSGYENVILPSCPAFPLRSIPSPLPAPPIPSFSDCLRISTKAAASGMCC